MFTYTLPTEKIAQRPVSPADAAKLLSVNRSNNELVEYTFQDLPSLLRSTDVLIFNDTKVMPYRLFGTVKDSAACEVLLLKEEAEGWRAIGRPLKKFRRGAEIRFSEQFSATIGDRVGEKEIFLTFPHCEKADLKTLIEQHGVMPIPPYIREGRGDKQDVIDYQPIFAKQDGSIASPTASLHFTPNLIDQINLLRVEVRSVTLHVGSASFLTITNSPPGAEKVFYNPTELQEIKKLKMQGKRIIAVGTTVIRALESWALFEKRQCLEGWYETELFIQPGYEFQVVDSIITNFHQPETTHLLLVEAFLGYSLLDASYKYALTHDFRFLSYGDGMFLQN